MLAFVHPQSGRTSFWLIPQLNAAVFAAVLAAFVKEEGFNEKKRLLLVLDGAGWHTSTQIKAPPGTTLIFQPAYSPELQPTERLWPITNEPIANQSFKTLKELETVLSRRCCEIAEMTDFIRGLTHYHWWPKTRAKTHSV